MYVSDVLTLYDYNYWATDRILDTAAKVSNEHFLAPAPVPYGSLRGTLVHVLDAEWSWRLRWQGRAGDDSGELRDEDFPTVNALVTRWQEDQEQVRGYLATLDDEALARHVDLPRGPLPLWLLLTHVVNHGTQHRSEAAVLLTGYGQSPGDIDFTVFARERLADSKS